MKNFISWLIYAFFVAVIINLFVYRKDVKTYIKECKKRWKELKKMRKDQKPLKKVKRKKIRNISAVKT